MRLLLFTLILLLSTQVVYAVKDKQNSEFPYIKPIAVEEAPKNEVLKVEAPQPAKEVTAEEIPTEKPKLDSDSDGVVDENDKCPETPEGIKVDENGCELDSDNDGVVNSKDQCPGTDEAFKVNDVGCPKKATLHINFESDKYDIPKEYMERLNTFAEFLKENSAYQIIVYGHTDSTGSEEHNKELSLNRAKSVRDSLTDSGIERMRLTIIGKGSEVPVADNDTQEGRAQNRRIEIELLQ